MVVIHVLTLAAVCVRAAAAAGAVRAAPNPVANPPAVVRCDARARFTVLTDGLLRAEFSPAGAFEDRATFAFVNRRLPVPTFTVRNATASPWCNITVAGGGMHVAYNKDAAAAAAAAAGKQGFDGALTVTRAAHAGSGASAPPTTWRAGVSAPLPGNLGGTLYQLDGCNGSLPLTCGGDQRTNNVPCTLGALSRAGWSVYDDTGNNVFDDGTGWWARSAHATCGGGDGDGACQDLYVSVYGAGFRGALRALASVAGVAPVPPRRFFGVWWSRWEKYARLGTLFFSDRALLHVHSYGPDPHSR